MVSSLQVSKRNFVRISQDLCTEVRKVNLYVWNVAEYNRKTWCSRGPELLHNFTAGSRETKRREVKRRIRRRRTVSCVLKEANNKVALETHVIHFSCTATHFRLAVGDCQCQRANKHLTIYYYTPFGFWPMEILICSTLNSAASMEKTKVINL